jgi:hypothetical protein
MRAPLKRLQKFACAVLVAASFQGIQSAHADWANFGTVSMTDATHPKLTNGYACYTDGRDIICDTGVGPIHVGPNGMINSGGMTVAGSVSASAVSATYVSATVLQINPSAMPCSTGLNGTIRYSSTSNTLEVCAGTAWSTLSSNTMPGNISGSGSATAVAFWNGPNSLSYDSGLYYDVPHSRLRVGNGSYTSTTVDASGTVRAIAKTSDANVTGIGQANVSNFVAWAPGTAQGQTVGMAFYPTFAGSADNGPRRAADIIAGFNNGTWGNQYLAFNVGGNGTTTNDAASTTIERVRITNSGNVGIGTQSPTTTLQVSGTFTVSNSAQASSAPSLYVASNGNVGIGTSTPGTVLEVSASPAAIAQRVEDGNVAMDVTVEPTTNDRVIRLANTSGLSTGGFDFFASNAAYNASRFRIFNDGRVGIGSGSPGSSLTVVGEVQVSSSGGACLSSTNGGAIRYSAGTLYYCNGSNTWASISGGGAGFTGGGSATAVAFWNGPSSLTYESATTSGLYWDHANGRLGIGTNAPGSALEVSTSTGGIRVNMNTSALPAFMADTSANNLVYLRFKKAGKTRWDFGANSAAESGSDVGSDFYVNRFADNEAYLGTPLLIERSSGNVGVGTTAPYATLQVSGTFTVSTTGQNSLASASLAVDSRGVSVSSIVHITGSAFSPIGAGGNAILSGTTAVSTSSAGSVTVYTGGNLAVGINSTGKVGVGKEPNSFPLSVGGTIFSGRNNTTVEGGEVDLAYPENDGGTTNASVWITDVYGSASAPTYRIFNRSSAGAVVNVLTLENDGTMWVGAASSYPSVQIEPAGAIGIKTNNSASGYWYESFYRNGSAIGTISQNGTTGVLYNTTSDRRMKENITDTREGLQLLMQLPVRDFAFRNDPSHTIVTGFIAQELNKVFPEAVTTNGDNGETSLKDKSKPWSVDYGRVTPLVVKAVQDLKIEKDDDIASLTIQLKAANDNIRELRNEIEQMKRARR